MNPMILSFMRWWNALAQRNGKLKFKNQREAAEFVRRVQNENGGPNAKLIAMRQKYVGDKSCQNRAQFNST